jgi:hypothetical protein
VGHERPSAHQRRLAGASHVPREAYLPDITDDQAAGDVSQLIDLLIDGGTITVPEPYRISLLSDDGESITGLVLNVERVGSGWPFASDGWSDIDNYVPSMDETVEVRGSYAALESCVSAVIGRADRCISFLHRVHQLEEASA